MEEFMAKDKTGSIVTHIDSSHAKSNITYLDGE